MEAQNVIQCSFTNWYKKFEDITITSIVLPIPSEVLNYLQDNGTLILPENCHNKVDNSEESTGDWDDENSRASENTAAIVPNFDSFNKDIQKSIISLGGAVFPKLNWSSPKDAAWISFNKTLQCSNPGDVYLLLKSSDFVTHDLSCPFRHCPDKGDDKNINYSLILRKWVEINPSDEFRCFVKDRELIGISQRDISQYCPSICKEKSRILDDIIAFWEETIRNYFPLMSYVFDVHRPSDEQVTLIDFGPFGPTTDGLLFTWHEMNSGLIEGEDKIIPCGSDSNRAVEAYENCIRDPEFRCITTDSGVQPSPYMSYGLPIDIVELSTGADILKLTDFLKMACLYFLYRIW